MGGKQSTQSSNEYSNKNNKSTSKPDDRITLDEAFESLEDYKQAINNVYSLSRLMDDYYDDFQDKVSEGDTNPINSVLLTTLHDGYSKETTSNYCEVIELGKNVNEISHCKMLFSCKQYEELDGMSIASIKTNHTRDTIDNVSYEHVGKLLDNRVLEMSRKLPAYGNSYIHAGLGVWTTGVRAYFNIIRKSPVSPDKWIMVSSGVDMKNYTSQNAYKSSPFAVEYNGLLENITQVMNSNAYLNIIEDSARDAAIFAEDSIASSEEKTALYNFSKKVLESAPTDRLAREKLHDATIAAQTASRTAANAVMNAKAAAHTLTESETQAATKTTTWEYGKGEMHDSLRCIYSGVHPQWNGMYIKDCALRGTNVDIAETTFSVMSDIEQYYPDLFNNQIILSTYKTGVGYYISIVKVLMRGDDDIHIQLKEANLNAMFPSGDGSSIQGDSSQFPYAFVDPASRCIGIGTQERGVTYMDDYLTTTKNNTQNVVIKSHTYPNLVGTRVAENSRHILGENRQNNYYYFDQFSSSTMRRQSNLYTFEQMAKYAEIGSPDADDDYKQRYGTDISFEITDRTNTTCEIGNVGMVIDKLDDDGRVCGGFSVKTLPQFEEIRGKEFAKPGETILYVSSDSLLHVNGVKLGSKILHTKTDENGEESLFWGETKVA